MSNETKNAGNRKFTVVLLRPDYVTDDYGHDVVVTHVDANDVAAAQLAAQKKVALNDGEHHPEDYHILAAFEGHLENVKQE